ncbi:MAG: hypothetical protein U1E83_01510 [Methylotetracoccus sp.]
MPSKAVASNGLRRFMNRGAERPTVDVAGTGRLVALTRSAALRGIIGAIVVGLGACHSFGPDGLKGTHPLYTEAISSSMNEQFVHNLVRLHYRDPAYFLDVSNVAATLKLDINGGLNQSSVGFGGTVDNNIMQFSLGADYQTQPTISYTPLQGENFVKSVLSALTLESVFALIHSGWNVRRVFPLCIERINGLENSPTASGPTPESAPTHDHGFHRLMRLIESLRGEQFLIPHVDPVSKNLMLQMRSAPDNAAAIAEIKDLLGLDPNTDDYRLSGEPTYDSRTIAIHTRSLMGIFFLLSHNVDVPPAHKEAGLVTITHGKRGETFDWDQTLAGKLLHIRQSESQPEGSFLAIPYRGHWYYIADNDLESKSTFMLLIQLFRLQAGSASSVAPALTIPLR